MNLTTREKAFKEGVLEGKALGKAEGKAEGIAELILNLLHMKFGSLTDEQLKLLSMQNVDQLTVISERIFDAKTFEDALGD